MIHPEDMPAVDGRLAALTTPGLDGYEAEYRILHKFGHWVWMMDRGRVLRRGGDGAPAFIAGIQMDISEQKERELALTAAQMARDTVEARLKDVVTVSEDIFLELDSDLRFNFLSGTLLEEGPGSQSLPAIGQTLEEWLASVRNVRSSTDWDGVLCTIADRLPIDNFTFCAPKRLSQARDAVQ
ncbi:PAS domain-containing protein [Cypionkella sp. TWP1-2-1b2]|uniref:PAS domain-containing protein n=1 Tax=Cypionkella sp. TWP1-2-1b2 TaxID=2804675 RepID=UPI003CF6D5BD